jgi:hypothetical protein
MSRMSRQCGILNISQPYRSSRPVTGMVLLFYFNCREASHESKCDNVIYRDRIHCRIGRNPAALNEEFCGITHLRRANVLQEFAMQYPLYAL